MGVIEGFGNVKMGRASKVRDNKSTSSEYDKDPDEVQSGMLYWRHEGALLKW